jgi:hypothetical protein
MSYNYGNITCNNLSIEHGGNQALMTTISQTTNDELNIDGPVIIDGDLQVTGVINATIYGGATIDASGGNGTYDYASIVYEDGNITNIISNTIPTSTTITASNGTYDYATITVDNGNITEIVSNTIPASATITAKDGNGTYNYANITYQDGNIVDITSNPTPASITVDDGTYDYATITVSDGNITEIVSNTIPSSATITADSNATYNYANVTYEDGNITNITSNPTPGTANITVDDGTYDYASITVADGNITSMVSNTSTGGYALLAGGTGSTSQKFTGYNQFNHGITLYNPQYLTSVSISSFGTTENTLSVQENISVPQKVTCNILGVASYISLGNSNGGNYIEFYDGSQQTTAYTGIPATVDCTTVDCTTVDCTTVNCTTVNFANGSSQTTAYTGIPATLNCTTLNCSTANTSDIQTTGFTITNNNFINFYNNTTEYISPDIVTEPVFNNWSMGVMTYTNPYWFQFNCPAQQTTSKYSPQWNFVSPTYGECFGINGDGGFHDPGVNPTVYVGTVTISDYKGTMELRTSDDVTINGISFKETINRLTLIEQRLNQLMNI